MSLSFIKLANIHNVHTNQYIVPKFINDFDAELHPRIEKSIVTKLETAYK